MKLKFSGWLAGIGLVALSSCSGVYKSAQTPDDVYYSPGKPAIAKASSQQNNNQQEYLETNSRRGNRSVDNGYGDYSYRDDQYLRMMISSGRYSNSYYNDYYYNGGMGMADPWMVNNWRWNSYMTWNAGFASPYNSMWYWNSFYNPYYYAGYSPYCYNPIYVVPGKGGSYETFVRPSRPVSSFAMGSYLNTNGANLGNSYRPGRTYSSSFNNSNNRNGSYYNTNNNSRRSGYGQTSESYNSSYDRPNRSYTPSSSNNSSSSGSRSSSGGSSGSSGGGGVSRPARTGH
ncbi:hypothetical protein [Flavihumibacter petaseus]|uniref:Uncharacterized protein n=1 Tax=Flavihumibacter petaseus NBRC 106054 TaxID=1220578 RepID=A0A0E9N2A6_9BACT|nr:hypothetical protein [Flavihumibacter petaseus]GAO43455.1 hypothetical protein FPE01S_02_05600 [Flavihumibacter petaseus NBRC 106054]